MQLYQQFLIIMLINYKLQFVLIRPMFMEACRVEHTNGGHRGGSLPKALSLM